MSMLASQAYLTSYKSLEKLKISFGRDPKLKFAWGEDASESQAYKKGPRPMLGSQTNKKVQKRKYI